jgi:PAS domain S-box-containing protein
MFEPLPDQPDDEPTDEPTDEPDARAVGDERPREGVEIAPAKYEALFRHFPLGITVCDRDGAILEVNPASELMLGIPASTHGERSIDGPEWHMARPDGTPLPPAEYASVRACRERVVVRDQEMLLVAADGSRRWLSVSAAPLAVGDLGALVVYEDVTERKRLEAERAAEQALRESERRFRRMAYQLPLIVWTYDPEHACTMVNKTGCDWFGAAEEQLLGRGFIEFLHPDDRDAYLATFAAGIAARVPTQAQCRARRADGSWRWIESHGQPVLDTDADFVGMLGASFDVSERKQAEEALQRSHDALQHYAGQLSRLASQLTLAEQRERERLAKLLHDHLQQLLVGAAFGIDRLARRLVGPEAPAGAADALAGVKDLLQEAVEAARTLVADLSPPILHEAGLGSALEWLARQMETRHRLAVALWVDADAEPRREDVRRVLFDSVREALFNVVKHTDCDSAQVRMSRDAHGCLCIEIRDYGAGFDPAGIDTGEHEGTGLGLLAMRERLRCLGGACHITRCADGGTLVTLTTPLDPAPQASEAAPDLFAAAVGSVCAVPDADAVPAGAVTVLLVDDHAMMRQGLRALLAEEPGLAIVGEAGDGRQALEMVAQLRPRLVLMDYSMPHMDGIEATRRIRRHWPEVCVIGLSMYQEADRAAAMLGAGARAYVDKTTGADALLRTIRATLTECGVLPG